MLIFLTGFMGSGKTTVGKKLAAMLNLRFVDLDTIIEQQEGMGINNIFDTKGEDYFREVEHRILISLLDKQQLLIACGGGTPCYFNAMYKMNQAGTTVYLQLPNGAIFKRLLQAKANRPLLNNLSEQQLSHFVTQKLAEREPIYLQAKVVVPAMGIDLMELKKQLLAAY